jgi:hypothetical protein
VASRECRRDFYELRHFGASYMPNEPEPYGHPDKRGRIDRIRRALGGKRGDVSLRFGGISGESRMRMCRFAGMSGESNQYRP